MIVDRILAFLGLVGFMWGIQEIGEPPPETKEARTIQLSGQARYRPAGKMRNDWPRHELVLFEAGQARLYTHGEIPIVQVLGTWTRSGDTLSVYGCTLIVGRSRLLDAERCVMDPVSDWRGVPPVIGW